MDGIDLTPNFSFSHSRRLQTFELLNMGDFDKLGLISGFDIHEIDSILNIAARIVGAVPLNRIVPRVVGLVDKGFDDLPRTIVDQNLNIGPVYHGEIYCCCLFKGIGKARRN